MSYEAMHQVRASGLTDRTQVDVLEALAFFHNGRTGACFPSTDAIARISRVNSRTVRLTLKALHDLGFISSAQTPGQKRYFTLHLDRLPAAEPLQESTPLKESDPLQELTGGEEITPLQELTGEGCKNLQGTPVKTYREPLQKLTPEQGNNKVLNKEEVTRNSCAPAPTKEKRPSKWILIDRPETVSPEAWKNFCQIRAVKRIPLTETAWKGIEKEAAKAGLSLSETIDICNEHGWAGFKNSWLQNANRSTGSTTVRHTDPQYGIGVCQPPKEPTRMFTPEEAEETRRQMMEEGLIF